MINSVRQAAASGWSHAVPISTRLLDIRRSNFSLDFGISTCLVTTMIMRARRMGHHISHTYL